MQAVQATSFSPTSLSTDEASIDDLQSLGSESPTSSAKKRSLMAKLKQRLTNSKPRDVSAPSQRWRRQSKETQWEPRPPPVPPEGAAQNGESPLVSTVPRLETPKLLRSQHNDENVARSAKPAEIVVPQPPKIVRYPTIISPVAYEISSPKLDPRESLREVNPLDSDSIAQQVIPPKPLPTTMPSVLPVFPRGGNTFSRTSDPRDTAPRGILHPHDNTKQLLRRSLPNISLLPSGPTDSNLKRVRFSNGSINDVTISVWEIEHDADEFDDVERRKVSEQPAVEPDESQSESEVWSNDACDGYRSLSLPRDFSPGPKLMDSHLTCSTIDDICNLPPLGAVEELVCLDIDALH